MDDELSQHLLYVYRYALRLTGARWHVAEDVAAETMLRALRSRSSLSEPGKAKVWLLAIASNVWRDMCRKSGRSLETVGDSMLAEAQTHLPAPEKTASLQEDVERSLAAMDRLPPQQRSCLYLTACESLSPREIAQVLNITPQSAKANLSLARAKMRKMVVEADPQIGSPGVTSNGS